MKRPKHLDAPDYLTPSPPIPQPELIENPEPPEGDGERMDPTRYGDWEKKGIAIDF